MKNILIIKLGGMLLNSNKSVENLFQGLKAYHQLTKQPIIIVNGIGSFNKTIFPSSDCMISKKNFCSIKQLKNKKILNVMLPNIVNIRLLAWLTKYNLMGQSVLLLDFFSKLLNKSINFLTIQKFFEENKKKILQCTCFLKTLLKKKIIPLVCSMGLDIHGNAFNINSDIVAMILTIALNGRLIVLTDVSSVLDGKGQRIKKISKNETYDFFNSGVVTNGMIKKIKSALMVSQFLNKSVQITSWYNVKNLVDLFSGKSVGTKIIGSIK